MQTNERREALEVAFQNQRPDACLAETDDASVQTAAALWNA